MKSMSGMSPTPVARVEHNMNEMQAARASGYTLQAATIGLWGLFFLRLHVGRFGADFRWKLSSLLLEVGCDPHKTSRYIWIRSGLRHLQ